MRNYVYYLVGMVLIGHIIKTVNGSLDDGGGIGSDNDNDLYDDYDSDYGDNDEYYLSLDLDTKITTISANNGNNDSGAVEAASVTPTTVLVTTAKLTSTNISSDFDFDDNADKENSTEIPVVDIQEPVKVTDSKPPNDLKEKNVINVLGAGFGGGANVKKKTEHPIRENVKDFTVPEDCSNYQMLLQQPAVLPVVQIPKCCNADENYYFDEEQKGCAPKGSAFNFNLIQAVFYDNCIEDKETSITYEIVEKPPCQGGLLYNEIYGDLLYILSNGSLLRISEDWDFYDIFNDYCIDMIYDEGNFTLSAISCRDKDLPVVQVSRLQGYICAIFMFVSVPFLLVVAAIYFIVPSLNDLHGKSLAMHSICLATGYLLLGFIQFTDNYEEMIAGYIIQYAILACFFWLLVMVMDISMQVWRYLPKAIEPSKQREKLRLYVYTFISQCTPLVFVALTYANGYHGIPSYYFRSTDAGDLDSQKFFIPVVSCILILAIFLSFTNECGFKKLNHLNTLSFMKKMKPKLNRLHSQYSTGQESLGIPELDSSKIDKVVVMRISTNLLLGVMFLTWLCEIISFYFTTQHLSPILFLDIINALQGVFIFMLFVCLPRPFKLIKTYIKEAYNDHASVDLTKKETELADISERERFVPTETDQIISVDNNCDRSKPLKTFGNHSQPTPDTPEPSRRNPANINRDPSKTSDYNNLNQDQPRKDGLKLQIENQNQQTSHLKSASITSEQSFVFTEQSDSPIDDSATHQTRLV